MKKLSTKPLIHLCNCLLKPTPSALRRADKIVIHTRIITKFVIFSLLSQRTSFEEQGAKKQCFAGLGLTRIPCYKTKVLLQI